MDNPVISPGGRILVASLGLGALLLLVTAWNLPPDPRGFGTHEQLGLAPCTFYRITGRLCPTCGATTAWAFALRGEIARAMACNLAATIFCGAAIVAVPWLILSAVLGRWVYARPSWRNTLVVTGAVLLVGLLDCLRRNALP